MKEQELSENQRELERSKSALARLAIAAKQANRPTSAPTVAPAPSNSPDSYAKPGSEAYKEWKRQNSLAWLHSIYDPLLTQLNLYPEQRARFYELRLAADDPLVLGADAEEELRNLLGAGVSNSIRVTPAPKPNERPCSSFGSRSTHRCKLRTGSMTACWTP
jgi:hypothetical protein